MDKGLDEKYDIYSLNMSPGAGSLLGRVLTSHDFPESLRRNRFIESQIISLQIYLFIFYFLFIYFFGVFGLHFIRVTRLAIYQPNR